MWTMNFQMFMLVLEKAEEPEIKLPTSAGSWTKQESSRKTSISALLTMPKPLAVWITINCGKFWEMGRPDHLICLLRNLYAGQEATVRTGHGTTAWFQIGKEVRQGCSLSPCLFNFYAEYIMRNAGLEETQAGIKTAGRNISNLRYADDTTLMTDREEEVKSLLMKVFSTFGPCIFSLCFSNSDINCKRAIRNLYYSEHWKCWSLSPRDVSESLIDVYEFLTYLRHKFFIKLIANIYLSFLDPFILPMMLPIWWKMVSNQISKRSFLQFLLLLLRWQILPHP